MPASFDSGLFNVLDLGSALVPGAKLYWYEAGGTTPTDTYTDSSLDTPNSNPVVADANARFPAMWLGTGSYKYILTDADGSPADPIVTRDDIVVAAVAPSYDPALTDFLAGDEPLPISSGGTGATSEGDALTALGAASLEGNTFTGQQKQDSAGAYLYNSASGMASGKVILQAAGSPPTMANGDWLAEY